MTDLMPGSKDAVAQGCICLKDGVWFTVNEECLLHGRIEQCLNVLFPPTDPQEACYTLSHNFVSLPELSELVDPDPHTGDKADSKAALPLVN